MSIKKDLMPGQIRSVASSLVEVMHLLIFLKIVRPFSRLGRLYPQRWLQ
jgi:hypothetical protein